MEIVASIFTGITSDHSTVEAVESDCSPHDAKLHAADHSFFGHMTTGHMTTYDTDSDDTEYICDDDSSSSCSSLSR